MTWRHHSEYYSYSIERLYDGEQPKAQYRCCVKGTRLTATNLATIKDRVKEYLAEAVQ